jgi:rod shape determining protein RodA
MIASTTLGESGNLDLATRQVVFASVGLGLFFVVTRFDFELWKPFSWVFYVFSMLLLIFVFLYGLEVRGSSRWIDLGIFRLQPSELVKLSSILVLASFMGSRNMKKIKNVILSGILMAVPLVFVFLQPDLGTAGVLAAVWIGMLMASGVRPKFLLTGVALAVIALPLLYTNLQDYQKDRITTFLNPGSDPLGSGYNVIQSTIAVGSGGMFGRGFGRGTQSHLNFLPEHHTDFIFATLAEELGLVGSLLLIGLLGILLWRLGRGILKTNRFGGLVLVGIFVLTAFQASVNIGMNIGLAPITGITLPFVSYGGSSLITMIIGIGLAQSIIRRRPQIESIDEEGKLG